MRYPLFILFFIIFCFETKAQYRQVGTWKYYINNRFYYDLLNIDENIFVNAHRLIFDVETDPIQPISMERTTGLADYSISTMAYSDSVKKLIVAYENTMLDVIDFKNGKKLITPNFDVYNKLIVADKSIQQIKFFRNRAYLCSKLGIIVFNYDKNEIESTFIIGAAGNQLGVNTLEIVGNKIYAATQLGIKEAIIAPAINLQDFNNWSLPLSSIPNDTFIRSAQLNGKTYWMSSSTFHEFDGNSSSPIITRDSLRILINLRKIENTLYIVYDSLKPNKEFYGSKVYTYDANGLKFYREFKDYKLYDIVKSKNKFYYSGYGLFLNESNNELSKRDLSSLPFDFPFRLQFTSSNKLIVNMGVMARNLDANLGKEGHFVMEKSYWYQYGIWGDSLLDCTNEISVIERDGGIYRAFVRGGVVFQNDKVKRFRSNNSKLENIGSIDYRVSDMVYNPIDSSIWIANNSSTQPLKCITNKGEWYSFDISSVTNSTEIYKILIDQVGNKWLLTRDDGVILFNEKNITNNSDNVIKQILEIKDKSCTLAVKKPLSGVIDRDGNLWIGSEKGIGMITSCTFDPDENCDFNVPTQVIVNPNDTTRYTECVFLNTPITSLAVDPGNRLWVGTTDGIFYNDQYLDAEFIRLNKLNSPFSVKSIFDILVHPANGEVFISTEFGLLSYMGQSTDAEINEGISPYRIIPNPVPSDYEGLITIDGLPENAFYKITDVVGNLMYQGKSNGSRVTWDTRTLNGYKVPTGVYYIFSSKSQLLGKQGIGKFTVVR